MQPDHNHPLHPSFAPDIASIFGQAPPPSSMSSLLAAPAPPAAAMRQPALSPQPQSAAQLHHTWLAAAGQPPPRQQPQHPQQQQQPPPSPQQTQTQWSGSEMVFGPPLRSPSRPSLQQGVPSSQRQVQQAVQQHTLLSLQQTQLLPVQVPVQLQQAELQKGVSQLAPHLVASRQPEQQAGQPVSMALPHTQLPQPQPRVLQQQMLAQPWHEGGLQYGRPSLAALLTEFNGWQACAPAPIACSFRAGAIPSPTAKQQQQQQQQQHSNYGEASAPLQ